MSIFDELWIHPRIHSSHIHQHFHWTIASPETWKPQETTQEQCKPGFVQVESCITQNQGVSTISETTAFPYKVTRVRARNQPPAQEDPVTRRNKSLFLSVHPRTSWNEVHDIWFTASPLLGCLNTLKHHKCKLQPSNWLKGKKEKKNREYNLYTDKAQ